MKFVEYRLQKDSPNKSASRNITFGELDRAW